MDNERGSIPRALLRIAAAQAQPVRGDVAANIAKVVELTEVAADRGVKLVVFPEKFLSGYEPDMIAGAPTKYAFAEGDARLAPIMEVCRRRAISAVVGAATRDEDGLHISSLLFGNSGVLVGCYHKQYLYSGEARIYQPGRMGSVLEIDGWRLGLSVCYDSGFPEHARVAAANGCHGYLISALFSVKVGYHQSRVWLPARAFDNTMYVLMSNHVGLTGGWSTCGSSAIWSPYGELLAEASADKEEIVSAILDPAVLADVRDREPVLADLNARESGTVSDYVVHRLSGAYFR